MTEFLITPAPAERICETNPESPNPNSPIWLLGHSPSATPQIKYLMPLDPRHPTRHTIWTPILHVIQRILFSKYGRRLDDQKLYIRNVLSDPAHAGDEEICKEKIKELRNLLICHQPLLVLCFGQFAFRCARRAQANPDGLLNQDRLLKTDQLLKKERLLDVKELSQEFKKAIFPFQREKMTLLPLLHQSVALKYKHCHEHFSGSGGNYFEYTGQEIAEVLIQYGTDARMSKLLLRAPAGDSISAL